MSDRNTHELPQKECYPGGGGNQRGVDSLPQKWCYQEMDIIMSAQTKREVLAKLRDRYSRAGKEHKTKLLDQVVDLFGLHRKAAIRTLRHQPQPQSAPTRIGRPREYDPRQLLPILKPIWLGCQQPCGKRLVAALPDWVPAYEQECGALATERRDQLLTISAATLDRLLAPVRLQCGRARTGTRPGTLLRQQIPIATTPWDIQQPGYLELDTVALCGGSLAGDFTWMLNGVDFCTQWVATRAVWNHGWYNTLEQLRDLEAQLPFALLGMDSDNGGELLNWHVLRYCHDRRQPVQMSRSRPYHKDDNAHVEQKNWTHIRQWFGYDRYDNPAVVPLLNHLTTGAWSQLLNYFCPAMKLQSKIRDGSRLRRIYDTPATPYARILAQPQVSASQKTALRKHRAQLNPFALNRQIEKELKIIYATARQRN